MIVDYAIVDTNYLSNPQSHILNEIYIPISLLKELQSSQIQRNFKNLQKSSKIIYASFSMKNDHNSCNIKNIEMPEIKIINPIYKDFALKISEYLNTRCSEIDIEILALTFYLECMKNNNYLLQELIEDFKDTEFTLHLENYKKIIEEKEFNEWKKLNPEKKLKKTIKCLTRDMGILKSLSFLFLKHLIFGIYTEKNFVLRCFTCKMTYKKERIFCKKCGNKTITRVSYRVDENGRKILNIKKNFNFKPRKFLDSNGKEIMSEDCRQWNFINKKTF